MIDFKYVFVYDEPMLWLRKIFFYIFCLVYLILCPLLIARMLGFVANPQTHQLVKTGLIYVSTNPPGASVFIDGRMAHEQTPTVIRDLPPGQHFVRLQLNGYQDWEKNVPIAAKKATVLENTLLIPQQWLINRISHKPYQNIITTAAGYSILVGINQDVKNMDMIHIDKTNGQELNEQKNHDITPLFPEASIYKNARLVRFFSVDKSPFILLEVLLEDKRKFLWVDLKEKNPRIEDMTDLFPQAPINIVWDASDEKNIFTFTPLNIYRINIKAKAIYPQLTALPKAIAQQQQIPNARQSFLINNKSNLLARKGNQIRIYAKENFGAPEIYDVTRAKAGAAMYFEEKTGDLFYLDETEGFLSSVQILRHRPMLAIPIAEGLRDKK